MGKLLIQGFARNDFVGRRPRWIGPNQDLNNERDRRIEQSFPPVLKPA